MGDDENIFASLEFHNDGFQTNDHVAVRLSASVSVVILILISGLEVFRVLVLDFLVCKAVTDAGIQFVQSLPLQLVIVQG